MSAAKTEIITVRFAADEAEQLRMEAAQRDQSVSEYIRAQTGIDEPGATPRSPRWLAGYQAGSASSSGGDPIARLVNAAVTTACLITAFYAAVIWIAQLIGIEHASQLWLHLPPIGADIHFTDLLMWVVGTERLYARATRKYETSVHRPQGVSS